MTVRRDATFEDVLRWLSIKLVNDVLWDDIPSFVNEKLKQDYLEDKLNIEESSDYVAFAFWLRKWVDCHLEMAGYLTSIDPVDHEDVIHALIDFVIRGLVYTPSLGEDRGYDVMVVYPISKLKLKRTGSIIPSIKYRLKAVPFAWDFTVDGDDINDDSKSVVVTYHVKDLDIIAPDWVNITIEIAGEIDAR